MSNRERWERKQSLIRHIIVNSSALEGPTALLVTHFGHEPNIGLVLWDVDWVVWYCNELIAMCH